MVCDCGFSRSRSKGEWEDDDDANKRLYNRIVGDRRLQFRLFLTGVAE